MPDRFSSRPLRVAIFGGGAAAVLLAHALARQAPHPIRISIIERKTEPGPGLAYSTPSTSHVLNVRAGRMSVRFEEPDHFLNWLNAVHPRPGNPWERHHYVPRPLFGRYLRDSLRALTALENGPCHVEIVTATAKALKRDRKTWRIALSNGKTLTADQVVLATGNEPPRPLLPADSKGGLSRLVLEDPWDHAARTAISSSATVLLVGTALTGIDIALDLLDRGHSGPIFAISRRGLLPLAHKPQAELREPWLATPYPQSARALVFAVRSHIKNSAGDWQDEIDALRPIIPDLWARLSHNERRRFLRHVQPYWDIHRHRIAPAVQDRLSTALRRHQIIPIRGRLGSLALDRSGVMLRAEITSQGCSQYLLVNRIVNCTGFRGDPAQSGNPLIRALLEDGFVRADPLRLGLDIDERARVIARDGSAQEGLFALGPLTRGRWWEIIAIPEIRARADVLAQEILRQDP